MVSREACTVVSNKDFLYKMKVSAAFSLITILTVFVIMICRTEAAELERHVRLRRATGCPNIDKCIDSCRKEGHSTGYRQAASAKPSVQQAGQAHDRSRTPPGDHKEQRKSSNVAGNDPSARSSWPRSEKWVASQSKSRSRSREPLSAQKHTEHDRIYTAPSPALNVSRSLGIILKRKPLELKYQNEQINRQKKVLGLGCSIYNTCKSLIQKDTLRQSYDCILQPVRNESSPHYTRLNLTKEHREVAANALACAWDVVAAHPSNIEALDDAAALTRRVVLTFGWT
ncbi:hypothetical protein MRX96_033086 [Rhipicephalus microplus]